jgi:glycerol-3-phosphate acyltransferase PlsY
MLAFFIFIVAFIISYLLGSLSSAIIVSRLFHLPDPRTQGSKNPGATNMLRIAGKKYAIIVLLADMLKGFIPVFFLTLITLNPITIGFACFAAVLGHMFPIYFQFKGGKGVATAIGAFLGIQMMMGVVVILTWLVVAYYSRYSSLASIMAITFAPFYSLFVFQNMQAFIPLMFITIFVLYQHRENISRLMVGEESKLSFKGKKP